MTIEEPPFAPFSSAYEVALPPPVSNPPPLTPPATTR